MLQYSLAHPYHAYYLAVVSSVYLVNQMDRYVYSSCQPPFLSSHQFDQISGILFTVPFTLMGVAVSLFARSYNKVYVLTVALVLWSGMTAVTGLSTTFWEVAVSRVGQAVGEAACTPFAAGIIASYFPTHLKATALSLYNVGVYAGFSIAQSAGSGMCSDKRWQLVYYVFCLIGVALAVVLVMTVKDSKALHDGSDGTLMSSPRAVLQPATTSEIFWFWVSSPSLVLLCVASGVKMAAGFVWGYQVKNWFVTTQHVPSSVYSEYMLWIPLVGGSLGAVAGGYISDRFVNRKRADGTLMGAKGRLGVIIVSLVLASPFAAGGLYFKHSVPFGFLSGIPTMLIGEMWVGIALTLVLELTPRNMHTASVSIYYFIAVNIGGNAPSLVTPIKDAIGGPNALKYTLLLLYPTSYLLSASLFLLTYTCVGRDTHRAAEFTAQAVKRQRLGSAFTPLLYVEREGSVRGEEEEEGRRTPLRDAAGGSLFRDDSSLSQ